MCIRDRNCRHHHRKNPDSTPAAWTEGTSKTLTVKAVSGATTVQATGIFTRGAVNPVSQDFNSLRIYQIMVEAFQDSDGKGFNQGYGASSHKGDLQGILKSLDYIKSLGVNAIWLTPIFQSTTCSEALQATGYYADNFFAVDPRFGSDQDLRDLSLIHI